MAAIPGSVRVAGFIAPTDSTDTYAVTDEQYNRGGYRSVSSLVERDSITPDRRKVGMLVYVTSLDSYYILSGGILNTHWTPWSISSGGSTPKHAEVIGNGTDVVYVVQHNLHTTDVLTQIFSTTTGEMVRVDWKPVTTDTIELTFAYPPALNSYRVVVIG